MKAAALMIFTVCYAGIRLKVRLLPTTRDVASEYRANPRKSRARIRKGKSVHAFTSATNSTAAKHTASIVLPSNGRLDELVPHEVFHAVMYKFGVVHSQDDEAAATAVGMLSARIIRKIRSKYHV